MVHCKRLMLLVLISVTFNACATATPPRSYQVRAHPLLEKGEGILLVVDPCLQRKEVGEVNEYFPIVEAKELGRIMAEEALKYIESNLINVKMVLKPFVCGAQDDINNPLRISAERIGGKFSQAQQPFAVGSEIDPDLAAALSKVATHGFQKAFSKHSKTALGSSSTTAVYSTNPEELKTAAALILTRTNTSSMLYIGLRGITRSTGVAVAEGVAKFTVGMVTGVATGLATGGLWVAYMPGGSTDGCAIGAALFNLDSGKDEWSNGIHSSGDPVKPGAVGNRSTIDALLRSSLYFPVRSIP